MVGNSNSQPGEVKIIFKPIDHPVDRARKITWVGNTKVYICVSILSLPMERYISKDISIMTRAINKWTTLHESFWWARFHHIHIFFLDLFLAFKRPKAPWTVSTTVRLSLWFFDLPWPGIYHLKNRHNKILSSKTCREQKT